MSVLIIWLKDLCLKIVKLAYQTHNNTHFHDLILFLVLPHWIHHIFASYFIIIFTSAFPYDLSDRYVLYYTLLEVAEAFLFTL